MLLGLKDGDRWHSLRLRSKRNLWDRCAENDLDQLTIQTCEAQAVVVELAVTVVGAVVPTIPMF